MAELKEGISATDRFLTSNLPTGVTEAARQAVSVAPQDAEKVLFSNLLLPQRIVNLLQAPLEALEYSLTQMEHYDDMFRVSLNYYVIPAQQGNAVLLYGSPQVLRFTRLRSWVAMLGPTFGLADIKACRLFIFSLVEVGVLRPYKTLAHAWQQRFPDLKIVDFFGLEDLAYWKSLEPAALNAEIRLNLGLDPHEMTPMPHIVGIKFTENEKDHIIDLIATQATTATSDPEEYLRDLVRRSRLPHRLEMQALSGLSGDVTIAARSLIDWALPKGPHPDKPEITILACLLIALKQDVNDNVLDKLLEDT